MPIYEYECRECGRRTELRRKVEERDREATCSGCGGTGVRVVSLPARAQFRGPGFYETDYRKK